MANKLQIVQDIRKELDSTVESLKRADKELDKVDVQIADISQNLRKAVSGFTEFKLPKDYEQSVRSANEEILKLNQAVDEQRKLILKLQAEITKLSQKRTASRKKGIEQRVAETALRKELRAQVRAVTDLG